MSADPKIGSLLSLTLGVRLLHGEVNVLRYTPPESRLLDGGATQVWSNSGRPSRNKADRRHEQRKFFVDAEAPSG